MANSVPRLPGWKKLVYGLATTAAALALLEAALAIYGVKPVVARRDPLVGFSSALPHFEKRAELGRPPRMRTAYNKLGYLNDQSFAVEKPEGTYRIFCLGGSTTVGRPYDDATSYVGWLRTLLEAAQPSQQWEVVNAGGVSYASYRVAALMEELTAYQPDLFIVYTGHNELLEDRTYGTLRRTSGLWRSMVVTASRTRIGATIGRLRQSIRTHTPEFELSDEVDTILDHAIGPKAYERDDRWHREVAGHFELSAGRMIDLARSAGAEIVFVRPASNLKDCSPFKSTPRDGLSGEQQRRWQREFERGKSLQQQGDHQEALDAFDEALAIDPRQADLFYAFAESRLARSEFEQAEKMFRRALDEDVCPLRMTSDIGRVLDRVVAEHGVAVVDLGQLLRQDCIANQGHPIPGREYFLDHVHPTIDVHRMLAVALAEQLRSAGHLPREIEWTEQDLAEVERRVRSTIDPAAHALAEANLARVLYWAGKVDEAGPLALKCQASSDDPRVLLIAGVYSQRIGETEAALDFLHRAHEMNPDDARVREALEAVGGATAR